MNLTESTCSFKAIVIVYLCNCALGTTMYARTRCDTLLLTVLMVLFSIATGSARVTSRCDAPPHPALKQLTLYMTGEFTTEWGSMTQVGSRYVRMKAERVLYSRVDGTWIAVSITPVNSDETPATKSVYRYYTRDRLLMAAEYTYVNPNKTMLEYENLRHASKCDLYFYRVDDVTFSASRKHHECPGTGTTADATATDSYETRDLVVDPWKISQHVHTYTSDGKSHSASSVPEVFVRVE